VSAQTPSANRTVAFIGLGMMGSPMAARLAAAGYEVRGHDLSADALGALSSKGGTACAAPREAAERASVLIAMLPNGRIVRDALLGTDGAAMALSPGALVIDMSSSGPFDTRSLGEELTALGLRLIDAPVSGGVKRAIDGTLAIMAGGDAADIERARPILEALGKSIFVTGPLGSGHAMKALNNFVSAAGLAAASEALIVGKAFGLAPETIVDILNVSTGRNNSTETKMKPFILSETFASGFSMALMAKDIRTAADLAQQLGQQASGIEAATALWEQASQAMGKGADHTSIYAYLAQGTQPAAT